MGLAPARHAGLASGTVLPAAGSLLQACFYACSKVGVTDDICDDVDNRSGRSFTQLSMFRWNFSSQWLHLASAVKLQACAWPPQ